MTTPAIIVGTGFLTPLYYEDPLTIPISYFQFLYNNTHLLTCLQTPHPLFLLTYLFGWINDCAIFCVILLNDFMDLHMSNLDTLVPEVPCCMQQGIMFTELWHIMRFFVHTLNWYHTYTERERAHWGAKSLKYKYIYQHHMFCSHSSYQYSIEWTIQWYQKFTFHDVFLFKNYSLVEVIYLLIRCSSSWETQKILTEIV